MQIQLVKSWAGWLWYIPAQLICLMWVTLPFLFGSTDFGMLFGLVVGGLQVASGVVETRAAQARKQRKIEAAIERLRLEAELDQL